MNEMHQTFHSFYYMGDITMNKDTTNIKTFRSNWEAICDGIEDIEYIHGCDDGPLFGPEADESMKPKKRYHV